MKYPKESDLDSDQTLRLFRKPKRESFLPKKPAFFVRLIPGANKRYRASVIAAEQCFSEELGEFEEVHSRRRNAMAILYASAEEHNQSVKAAEAALTNNDPEAISNYFELGLSMSEYPGKFPRKARVAFARVEASKIEAAQRAVDMPLRLAQAEAARSGLIFDGQGQARLHLKSKPPWSHQWGPVHSEAVSTHS